MKKQINYSRKRQLTLADLMLTLAGMGTTIRESNAAVIDLLESGRVRLLAGNRRIRARVC